MITLDIISDPICPWCLIGKTKLDRALAARPDRLFDVFWRPFQLNPDMPPEGMDRARYLETKFGGPENARRIYARIEQAAREAGLDLDISRIARTPNTIDPHRLIRWARAAGAQPAVVDRLFESYFMRGEDISDRDLLADIAESAGMERETVARHLAGDADIDAVRAEDVQAREMGVSGVPTFILGGRHALQGAQETETWTRVLDEIGALAAAADDAP